MIHIYAIIIIILLLVIIRINWAIAKNTKIGFEGIAEWLKGIYNKK